MSDWEAFDDHPIDLICADVQAYSVVSGVDARKLQELVSYLAVDPKLDKAVDTALREGRPGTTTEQLVRELSALALDLESDEIVCAKVFMSAWRRINTIKNGRDLGEQGKQTSVIVRTEGVLRSRWFRKPDGLLARGFKPVPAVARISGEVLSLNSAPQKGGEIVLRSNIGHQTLIGLVDTETAKPRIFLDI